MGGARGVRGARSAPPHHPDHRRREGREALGPELLRTVQQQAGTLLGHGDDRACRELQVDVLRTGEGGGGEDAADAQGIYRNPLGRFDRTLDYFLTVAVADARTAVQASELLMKVHAKATGTEPISGRPYSANDPDSQLWIHVTGWHSVLLCFERYGPGPLSPEDEARYWADCVTAAALQTCDPALVPRSRQDVRDYYAQVRPRLGTSERANEGMHYLLRTPRANATARLWAGSHLMAPATIATLPRWMRRLGGYDQPAALDTAIVAPTRLAVRAAGTPAVMNAVLDSLAPRTAASYAHWLSGAPARRDETLTPAEAFARYGRTSAVAA